MARQINLWTILISVSAFIGYPSFNFFVFFFLQGMWECFSYLKRDPILRTCMGAGALESVLFYSGQKKSLSQFSVAVCSRYRKHVSRRSSETGVWHARARVAFALWCAWRPRPTNFWPCSVGMGASVADLRLDAVGDGACFPLAAVSGGFRHCRLCWLLRFWSFLHCVVV